jgi:hypothetical protein
MVENKEEFIELYKRFVKLIEICENGEFDKYYDLARVINDLAENTYGIEGQKELDDLCREVSLYCNYACGSAKNNPESFVNAAKTKLSLIAKELGL